MIDMFVRARDVWKPHPAHAVKFFGHTGRTPHWRWFLARNWQEARRLPHGFAGLGAWEDVRD